MKKLIPVAIFGLLLNTARLIAAENFLQNVVAKHSHSHCDCSKKKGPTGPTGPMGPPGPAGPIGPAGSSLSTLSASSATSQNLTTSITPLSFDAYEFNTGPNAIIFYPTAPTAFALVGPGVFLIEASGILSTTATTSTSDNVQISLYNLNSATAVSPAPLYNWETGFAAPSGTANGFGISRAVQLLPGQIIVYEIVAVASSASTFAVDNKVLNVTQLQ